MKKTLLTFALTWVGLSLLAQFTTQAVTQDVDGFYQWSNSDNWVSSSQPNPLATNINDEIFVNGYISRMGNLSFVNEGANSETLTINDTLVVYGNMLFENNSKILVVNGVLIVFGDMENNNKADITNNGTIIVTGNLTLNGGQQDYNDSNGGQNGLFVGGTVSGNGDTAGANNDIPGSGLSFFGPEIEDFVTGGGASPLPVELTTFDATSGVDGIKLVWKTASELNNDYFSVERSEDGANFYEIGRVQGNGTTDIAQVYSFIDRSPISKIEYYRLRQVDFDGQFEIHRTVVGYSDRLSSQVAVEIYPNPASEKVTLKTVQPVTYNFIKLVDQSGKIVADFDPKTDGLRLERDLPKLKGGIYFIKYETTSGVSGTKKLMIR